MAPRRLCATHESQCTPPLAVALVRRQRCAWGVAHRGSQRARVGAVVDTGCGSHEDAHVGGDGCPHRSTLRRHSLSCSLSAAAARNAQTPPPCTMRRVRGSGATPSVVVDNPPASALDTVRKGRGGNLPFAWRTQPQGTPHPPPTEGWIHPRPPHPPRWLQPNNQIRPCTMRAAVPRNRDVANLTTEAQRAMAAAGSCAMPFKSSPRRRTKRGAAQAPATGIAKRS